MYMLSFHGGRMNNFIACVCYVQYVNQKLTLKTLLRTNFTRYADGPPTMHFTFWAGPFAKESFREEVC